MAISRNGGGNVFQGGTTVTITVLSVTGAGLAATIGTANTISIPSTWGSLVNGAMSSAVTSTVTLTSTAQGFGSGSIRYQATGLKSDGSPLSREDTMAVTWTTGTCVVPNTPPVVTVAGVAGDATYNKGSVPAATCNVIDEDSPPSFAATLSAITGTYARDDIGSQTASCSYTDAGTLTDSSSVTYSIVDAAAPVIDYTLTPDSPSGLNGWHTGNVSLLWSVSEPQSPNSLVKVGCVDQSITTDQDATTYTCDATSAGGSATQVSVTIKRDATAPTLTATARPAANLAGYNNGSVAVKYICSDDTSGLAAPCPAIDNATTDGTHVFDHVIFDNAGNSSSVSTTVKLDATEPTIIGTRTPANGAGWNDSDVTVSFTCADDGTEASGIKTCVADGSAPASEQVVSTEGANQSVGGTATDNADNTSTATVGDIKIDKTRPVITFAGRTPSNLAGWNNTSVTVTWNCSDLGSGVVLPTVSQTLTTEGADQSTTGTCRDVAGNTAEDDVDEINIDTVLPGIALASRTPANLNGWNNTEVTVSWNCTDPDGSGVVDATVNQPVTTEGADQLATGTCRDLAGNTASDTHEGINIDTTAPEVVFTSASPAANEAGWNKTDVTATFTATDSRAGVAGPASTGTGTATTSGEGTGLTVASPTFTDLAGNTAGTVSSPAFKVDKTAPTVSLVGGPGSGSSYYFGADPSAPTCAASDPVSGIASCVVTGGGTSVGVHTYTATATDLAGNVATATNSYRVEAWTLRGFYSPVDMGGVWNTVKGGSTVPLKFEVFSGSTELTNTPAVVNTFKIQKVLCGSGSGVEDPIEVLSTGGTSLRYDGTGGQFIQNWKTPTGPGVCYSATMTTFDGTSITALFKLK